MDFLSLGIAIFANLLLQLLAPKPELTKPKKYGLSDFSLPTATEDRAISLIFGTVPVAGNCIWSGDYYAEEMTREVDTGLFSSATQTYGYRYHIGMWLSLCGSTVDSLEGVLWGDDVAWTGSQLLSKMAVTDVPVNFSFTTSEGQEVPDGIQGTLRFFNQGWTENTAFSPLANSYMQSQLGLAQVPAYPGTCHVVLLGPSVGNSGFVGSGPSIPALQLVLKRLPAIKSVLTGRYNIFLDGTNYAYPVTGPLDPGVTVDGFVNAFIDSNADIDGDANPAFAIAELLCARMQYVGPRLSAYALDWSTIMRAAETLKSEGHGVSFAWEESRSVGDVVDDICKQINGVLQLDERTGRLQLKLIRQADASVMTFDNSNIVEFATMTRVILSEAPGEVQVPYTDRSLAYESRTAVAKNTALIQQLGTVVSRTSEFIGVSNSRLASILASRELLTSASSLAQVRFTGIVPLNVVLKPGDVITVSHERLGQTLRMRITSGRSDGYSNRQQVEFEAVEDVFRNGTTTYTSSPGLPVEPAPDTTVAVSSPILLAAPYALTGDDMDRPMYAACATSATSKRLRMSLARDVSGWSAGSARYADSTNKPAISGTLNAVLASTPAAVSANVTLTAGAAAAFTALGAPQGCLAIVGSEWVYVTTLALTGTTLALGNIQRGMFDTAPRRHLAGTGVTLLLGYAVSAARLSTRLSASGPTLVGAATVAARCDTLGSGGTVNASAAAATEAVFSAPTTGTGRAIAPLGPAYVTFGGQLGVASLLDPSSSILRSTSVALTWRNRNRLSRSSAGWFTAINDNEANAYVEYALDWETTAGTGMYTSNPYQSAAVGAISASVNTTGIPTGARGVRLTVRASRPSGSGQAQSTAHDYYWIVTT